MPSSWSWFGSVSIVLVAGVIGVVALIALLNIVGIKEAAKLNTLDLAQHAKIIVSSKALEAILARVNGGKN